MNNLENATYNHFLVARVSEAGIGLACAEFSGPPTEELVVLLASHKERLQALTDKPVLLNVEWDDGDSEAFVTVIPCGPDADPNAVFQTFTLAFP